MAIVAALALVFFLLIRPMEFVPVVAKLFPLEALSGLTALAIAWEVTNEKRKLPLPPQLPWLGAFVVWCLFVTLAKLGMSNGFSMFRGFLALSALFMLLVTFAARSIERLRAMALLVTLCMAFVAGVAVHQGVQPPQCIEVVTEGDDEQWTPDGRPCLSARTCETEGKEGMEYACERVGMLATFTTGWRVRWRGQMADPNELAVMLSASFPLLLAFVMTRTPGKSSKLVTLLTLAAIGLSLTAIVLTQSRGGQLALGAVAAIYFVRRFGLKGFLIAGVLAAPIVLLSWREGSEAESSSIERATILYEGIDLVRAHPFMGVGIGQFQEEISIGHTAHNSYLLVAAELGPLGCFLWLGLVWSSLKTSLELILRPPPGLDVRLQRFAEGIAISICGVLVGIFFLSFAYKQILFVLLGLSGALFGAVHRDHPDFRVPMTRRDLMGIALVGVVVLFAVFVLSRVKGGGG